MTPNILLAQGGGARQPSLLELFVPMILMFVIMYIILIKPQQKKQKQHQEMLQKLKAGDRVLTSGGIYGTIAGMKENAVTLKIADNVKIEISRSSITDLITQESTSTKP